MFPSVPFKSNTNMLLNSLNLTCANRVFIVELQWNPSVENQAIARAIRLGQGQKVLVTRYVIKETVEVVCIFSPNSQAKTC